MPVIFYSRDKKFIEMMKNAGFKAHKKDIRKHVVNKKTFYVSPANSQGYMGGGLDYVLTTIMPNIDIKLRKKINKLPHKTNLNKHYLPIGSSLIVKHDDDRYLVCAPTMLIPQDVSNTKNAFYATIATLYNLLINNKYNINEIDIIFTSMCCGYGNMDVEISAEQMIRAIESFDQYNCINYDRDTILNEPNLSEQPRIFDNDEWFD